VHDLLLAIHRDKSLYVGHTRDPNKPRDETFQMDEAAAELASAVLDMGEWLSLQGAVCLKQFAARGQLCTA